MANSDFVGMLPSIPVRVSSPADRQLRRQGATTYFFSTSGGHTENIENSFVGSKPVPYLKGVPDGYDDLSPYHRWKMGRRRAGQAGGHEHEQRRSVRGRAMVCAMVRRRPAGRIGSKRGSGRNT
jgi:peptidoglycan hydrolase-like amidase